MRSAWPALLPSGTGERSRTDNGIIRPIWGKDRGRANITRPCSRSRRPLVPEQACATACLRHRSICIPVRQQLRPAARPLLRAARPDAGGRAATGAGERRAGGAAGDRSGRTGRSRRAWRCWPATRCRRGPNRWRWPMPGISSAISCRSLATGAPTCWARSSGATASAATSS